MFSVIIPITELSNLVLNNIRLLSLFDKVNQIILMNIGNNLIELPNRIRRTEVLQLYNENMYDALSETIKNHVDQDRIIILDSNIQVSNKFISKLITYYVDNHLFSFRVNTITDNNAVEVDIRSGNKLKPNLFNVLAIAFNKNDALAANCFDYGNLEDFAQRMSDNGIRLKFLSQVLVHRISNYDSLILNNEREVKEQEEDSYLYSSNNKKLDVSKSNETKGTLGKLRNKPKVELNESRLMKDKGFKKRDLKRTYSIIIPVMVKGDRYDIFLASLDCLYQHIKKFDNIEIILHETDVIKKIPDELIEKYNLKYRFSYWDKSFHRSWALNVPAKYDAIGDTLVFFDADLIISPKWVEALLKCKKNKYYIGWGDLRYLSLENTNIYLNTGRIIDDKIVFLNRMTTRNLKSKTAFDIGCGGINVIPREMFFDIKGWPENYAGLGYGGEDNSMNYKIIELGYKIEYFPIKIFHLYHGHTTQTSNKRFPIKQAHKNFTKRQWQLELQKIGDDWGKLSENKNEESKDNLRVLWLTMDRRSRVANHFDDFRNTFCKLTDTTVLYQTLHGGNLPNKQHEEYLTGKRKYRPMLTGALNYDYIICDAMFLWMFENWGNINIPTAIIIEDQHGKVPERQIQHAIKHGHTIIHRYKFNKFHKDISKKAKTLWLPHSVNTDNFKDYQEEKVYSILSTGSIGNVYKTRIAVHNAMKDEPIYRRIERPVDNSKIQWPVQDEYSRELNKSWLSVCCGSFMEYPVMKFFEIPASRSVLYSDYFKELEELGFIPDKNMIAVDKNDIKGQVNNLLKNKNKLNRIANEGYNLIHQRHTNEIRANELLNFIAKESKGKVNDGFFDRICSKYDILDCDHIKKLSEIKKPLVTVAMLSFKRFDILIESLKRHLQNDTPLNLVLRVQCCEDLSKDQKDQIIDLTSKFYGCDLQFTTKNLGSGIPRHDVMNRALTKFNTPYILTTDDDMLWEPYSILSQVSLLESRPEYGLISSTCAPNYPRMYRENGEWKFEQVIRDNFVDAHLIGSATSIYRREVFDKCEYDKNYTIGCGDYDLCMQIDRAGWKIGVMNIPELKSLNNNKGNTQEYRSMRYNKKIIRNSILLFKRKWGTLGIGGL